jgi:RHS repeat-associated protein
MTEDYYYNTDWKCVEERDSGKPCPRKQYVYGIRGRNDIVARDNYRYNSSSGSPSCSSAGKERHYALADAMGTTTAITNTSGTVAERYSYTAFGQSQVMTTSFANRSMSLYDWQTRFHGESRDEETGYYNYGYRYYLPELGKWPSRDPLADKSFFDRVAYGKSRKEKSKLRDESLGNLYAFVKNDGLNSSDYLGLRKFGIFVGEISIIGCECCPWLIKNFRWISEDGGAELKPMPDPPKGRHSADALYIPGKAIKVNDLGTITIRCYCKTKSVTINAPLLTTTTWKHGDKDPPEGTNWPGGPNAIPPYATTPPPTPKPKP